MNLDNLTLALQNHFGETVAINNAFGEITLEIAASDLLRVCKDLRDRAEFHFDLLLDLCGVDYLDYGTDEWTTRDATFEGFSRGVLPRPVQKNEQKKSRFACVYHLLSSVLNHRLRIKVFAPGEPPIVASVLDIWRSANWYERETFDLFGILFSGHPDLRRLLTDYGFVGHPFRKDFPLIGQVEMRYDATMQRVVYEPVSIAPRTLAPKVIRYIGQNEDA